MVSALINPFKGFKTGLKPKSKSRHWFWWQTPVILAVGMSRQKGQGFRVMLGCTLNLNPAWVIWDPVSREFKPLVRNHSREGPVHHLHGYHTKLFCSLPTSLGFVFWATPWLTAKGILVCLPSFQTTEVCMLSVCRKPSMAAVFFNTGTQCSL